MAASCSRSSSLCDRFARAPAAHFCTTAAWRGPSSATKGGRAPAATILSLLSSCVARRNNALYIEGPTAPPWGESAGGDDPHVDVIIASKSDQCP